MADNWDDEDSDVVQPTVATIAVTSKWDGEDAEDDIKDSWDASDDDEKPPAKSVTVTPSAAAPTTTTTKPSKKKALSQKIAERQEEEERKKRELAKKLEAEVSQDGGSNETLDQRKERLARSVRESDLENARALLGDLEISGGIPSLEGSIESLDPTSRGEFDDFVKVVMKKFSTFEKRAQYIYFVESLLRELVIPTSVDDTRHISSSLTAMINEKQRMLKESQNKGKKKAPKNMLKGGSTNSRDTTNYEAEVYDDFDDFM
ncbi:hypothetical protein BASA82_000692 [Batrachochytrium salamandrivorans]|uniref:Eukaryotic translation initiation factor 3 subunit J n=1 Tax=Batrachochytrium salamandrivorans TaxID=1357716 RepID=A0ABQ8F9Y8_9FUNG|nr:hypothetical protein BASA50_006371 [Batrachochytrium salamandrivorans]KAH6603097.1 hypothetical protein BASA61_000459 [Batrachochytrium salamandrivorans]KAH9257544.1 hypothetical protein BASA81_004306 [Batrachochytrium salamandrivorans]KAH9262244.1 hypothetical protein BASA82_000692 [Batrachochytrium salamandrivorans]KAH9267338.1 hypothetical protein BASA84_000672 [Batrachochytrium salamandrivorans]